MTDEIPFNRSHIAGNELTYITEAVRAGELKGDSSFTLQCHKWLEQTFSIQKALLTPSCTAALELAAILVDLKPGDEVILPSFTFTSTANAFLLRGATLRFIDIRPDTLNLDESKLPQFINEHTKVICPVHYAGVACEMDSILTLARAHSLSVIEDAAHGIMAKYKGRFLGSLGDLATFSFHQTKNYNAGEGGALAINNPQYEARAEIIREKGTNRSSFFRGEVDKYSWVDLGSSYLPSEIVSAFLWGQFEYAHQINEQRLAIWNTYAEELGELEDKGHCRLPRVPRECEHNGHMFYLLMNSAKERSEFISWMKDTRIGAVFHYLPLHTAPMGRSLGYESGMLPVTEDIAERIVRLPLYCGLTREQIDIVVNRAKSFFRKKKATVVNQ